MVWNKNNTRSETEGEEKSFLPFVYAVKMYSRFQANHKNFYFYFMS